MFNLPGALNDMAVEWCVWGREVFVSDARARAAVKGQSLLECRNVFLTQRGAPVHEAAYLGLFKAAGAVRRQRRAAAAALHLCH